jgi:hypothetical protein
MYVSMQHENDRKDPKRVSLSIVPLLEIKYLHNILITIIL